MKESKKTNKHTFVSFNFFFDKQKFFKKNKRKTKISLNFFFVEQSIGKPQHKNNPYPTLGFGHVSRTTK